VQREDQRQVHVDDIDIEPLAIDPAMGDLEQAADVPTVTPPPAAEGAALAQSWSRGS